MKKLFTGLILAAICLLPALMAILVYIEDSAAPISTSSITSLLLEGPAGGSQEFLAKEKEGEDFIDFLLELNRNAEEVDTLPKEIQSQTPYKATFISKGVRSVYQYYFSPTHPSNSYYVDPQKKVYRIAATDTIDFLDGEYSVDLYPGAALPTLSVAGNPLNAATIEWTYFTYTGKSHPTSRSSAEEETPLFSASYVGITIDPSLIPDESHLVVTDDSDSVLYQGSLSDYRAATSLKKQIRKDTLLHFSLQAKWVESDTAKYAGTAEYHFDVQTTFDPAANFWLGETSVELGEMVVISGEFVEDLEDLSFTSSPALGFTPTFVQDGNYVRTLLPIPRNLAAGAGTYTLTVICQGKEYPLTLEVTAPTHSTKVRTYNYSGAVNTHLRTEENLAEFRNLIGSLPVTTPLQVNAPFYLNQGEAIRVAYGETVHNTGKTEDQFLSGGAAFVAYYGTPIYGANRGTVALVTDTAYGGKTVVVDHGWGLFSVYYCLGSVAVEVGQQVTTDTIIGYGGRSTTVAHDGYTDGITSYWELWVGGQSISYLPLLDSTIQVGSPD